MSKASKTEARKATRKAGAQSGTSTELEERELDTVDAGAGNSSFSDFSFTTVYNKASPS